MDRALKNYEKLADLLTKMTGGVIGYLVPGIDSGRKVERTLIRGRDGMDLRRPFGWAEFEMETGVILFYRHCIVDDFTDTQAYPLSTVMSREFNGDRTAKQQMEYEKKLWECYLKIREFVFEEDPTEEQKALMREYQQLWELTVLKDLAAYYETLSPEFFAWLSV